MIEYNFDELIEKSHTAARDAGWWTNLATKRPFDENEVLWLQKFALMHSEISEALEGDRKNRDDDHLPQFKSVVVECADALIRIADSMGYLKIQDFTAICYCGPETDLDEFVKMTVAEQLAIVHMTVSWAVESYLEEDSDWYLNLEYTVGLILEMADTHKWPLAEAIEAKLAYNAKRADHKMENRVLKSGKAY